MNNYHCKFSNPATSLCTEPKCLENPFICRDCENQICFTSHGHGRGGLISIQQFEQKIGILQRLTKPCEEIFDRIEKEFRKMRELIEDEFNEYQKFKISTYSFPEQIEKIKEYLYLKQYQQIKSKDIAVLLDFCNKIKSKKILKLNQYVELENKIHRLGTIKNQLQKQLKDLYNFPESQIRKICVTWSQPFNANWEYVNSNQIANQGKTNILARSKELLSGGQFQINFEAKVIVNAHFGITKKNSQLTKLILNTKYPLETKDTYSYHIDKGGRIYKQQTSYLVRLKGKDILTGLVKIKMKIHTELGYVEWYNNQILQGRIQGLQLTSGVYVVVSIDEFGSIKVL